MSILIQRTGGMAAQVKSIYVRDSLNVARKVKKGIIRHTDGTDKVFYQDRYYIYNAGVYAPGAGSFLISSGSQYPQGDSVIFDLAHSGEYSFIALSGGVPVKNYKRVGVVFGYSGNYPNNIGMQIYSGTYFDNSAPVYAGIGLAGGTANVDNANVMLNIPANTPANGYIRFRSQWGNGADFRIRQLWLE